MKKLEPNPFDTPEINQAMAKCWASNVEYFKIRDQLARLDPAAPGWFFEHEDFKPENGLPPR